MFQGPHHYARAVALQCRLCTIAGRPRQSILRWSAPTPAKCLAIASASPTHTCIQLWSMHRAASGVAQARTFSASTGLNDGSSGGKGESLTEPIVVLVRLSPGGPFEVVDTSGPRVGHVKVAIIATFKKRFAGLDPDELQLVKLDGSCRTLLDPELTLSAADVHDGARLEVQRVASAFKVEPLRFRPETVGGVPMMVGWLLRGQGFKKPIFLTIEEYRCLFHFLKEAPDIDTPQMLLLIGTIKSGKSTLLQVIEPLVAALREDDTAMRSRPPPVFFKFNFIQRCRAADAAATLVSALRDFARLHGIALQDRGSAPFEHFAAVAEELALGFDRSGRELWLLFDEAQGPILGSAVGDADAFMHMFKQLVMTCCLYGRIVVTGSGLAALLDAVRKSPPNGFSLWDAGVRLPLGREPSLAAALGMAEHIIAACSTKWPEHARAIITAPLLVTSLASLGDAPLYSPRPALVAYVIGCVGDAQYGAPDELLAEAVRATAVKLVQESSHDVARLLLTMDLGSRVTLRKLADNDLSWAKQLPGKIQDVLEALFPKEANTGRLFASLCEADWPLRLMPPYGNLVHNWIETDGRISFVVEGDHLVLLPRAQAVLTFISDRAASIPPTAQNAASAAVLDVLVHHGLGIRAAGGALRAPRTADEMRAIPAIAAVAAALDLAEQEKSKRRSPHVLMLDSCQTSLGWWLIKALRHLGAHVYFGTPYILRNGLTAATATAVTRAAADAIVATSGGKIVEKPDGSLNFSGRSP